MDEPSPAAAPAVVDRKRGVKRDRSRSPSPAVHALVAPSGRDGGAAAAAAAADHHADVPSPSFPPASIDLHAASVPPIPLPSSSFDMGGTIDEEGVYRESEAERIRKENLAKSVGSSGKDSQQSRVCATDKLSNRACLCEQAIGGTEEAQKEESFRVTRNGQSVAIPTYRRLHCIDVISVSENVMNSYEAPVVLCSVRFCSIPFCQFPFFTSSPD